MESTMNIQATCILFPTYLVQAEFVVETKVLKKCSFLGQVALQKIIFLLRGLKHEK